MKLIHVPLALLFAAAITVTPALARHGHHRPHEGHHHRQAEEASSRNSNTHHDTRKTEQPRHGVLDMPVSGNSSPLVRFEADLSPDSQPGLWRMGEAPKPVWGHRPKKLVGALLINDDRFPVVSGGTGWSIPYGHWRVTPQELGPWGSRHNAIGLNDDTIPDAQLHRDRDGVEIHATNHNATAGCVGVRERFDALRSRVLAMVEEFGKVWLHVLPTAMAITPTPTWEPTQQTLQESSAEDDDDTGQRHRRHAAHHRANDSERHARHHHRSHSAFS